MKRAIALGECSIDVRSLAPLMRKELRDAMRNRWLLLYAIAFAALAVALSYMSQVGSGMAGMAGFGKTAASLVNLTLLLTPLMGLTIGALSLTGERDRGMLAYLLAQPVSRAEVLVAKFLGQALAFAGAIAIGFGVAALAMGRSGDGLLMVRLAGLSALLAISMLAIGMLIAAVIRRSNVALGMSVFAWFALVLVSDLGLMSATTVLDLSARQLLLTALASPTQVFKLAAISSFDATLDLLGPAGLYATQAFGAALAPLLISLLIAWCVAPLLLAGAVFIRRPL
ncbi:MAG: ABC transporter permease [Phycisphaerales bacterium JB039]